MRHVMYSVAVRRVPWHAVPWDAATAQAPPARLLSELDSESGGPTEQSSAEPDRDEREVLSKQTRALAIALGNAINMLNPGLIVLGGFLRVFPRYAAEALRAELARHSMTAPRQLVRIVPATLGADTLMIGAAELAFAPVLADPGRN